MENIVKKWKDNKEDKYLENLTFLKSIRTINDVDTTTSALHNEVFEEVDCLQCANCCRSTPAIIEKSDAKRIAKYLGIPPKIFIKQYLLEDFNGELMINGVPCTFLKEDNTCQIYEVRPNACREYPHTNQSGFYRRAKMNAKNTIVCPAVYEIVERLKIVVGE